MTVAAHGGEAPSALTLSSRGHPIAAVVVNGAKLKTLSREQQRRAVKVSASVLTTDPYEEACQILPNVNTLTRNAANQAYETAGVGPEDLDLVELHDCFATAEILHYENLGLCGDGEAGKLIDEGTTAHGGRIPVNPSGGLESKGHPVGATGLAQVYELTTQLRGEAGSRQVEGARFAIAENGGGFHGIEEAAACVTILGRG